MVNLDEIKKEAKNTLEDGKVKYIIGYTKSSQSLMAAPVFVKKPEDVNKLIWDPTCFQNLVKFLLDEKRKKNREKEPDTRPVGIFVKGCDSRAINVLLQENFIKREDVYIMGISCEDLGVLDEKKIFKKLKGEEPEKIEFDQRKNIVISYKEKTIKIPLKEILAERCLECTASFPVISDVFWGDRNNRSPKEPFKSLEQIESLSQEKKWDFWQQQLSKCIRCYACRSVCPMCYCDECVVDSINLAVTAATTSEEKAQKIKWIEKSPESSENFGYHLVRAMHLAGRCIDCSECERVCPVDIPLRFLNKKLEKVAKELFDYKAGLDPEQPSLVSSFKDEDPEDFIR